jgi:hypothetical protein
MKTFFLPLGIILFSIFLFSSCQKEEMRYCWIFEVTTTTVRDPLMPPYPTIVYDMIDRCWLTVNEARAVAQSYNSSMSWYGSGYTMTEIKTCTKYYIY